MLIQPTLCGAPSENKSMSLTCDRPSSMYLFYATDGCGSFLLKKQNKQKLKKDSLGEREGRGGGYIATSVFS